MIWSSADQDRIFLLSLLAAMSSGDQDGPKGGAWARSMSYRSLAVSPACSAAGELCGAFVTTLLGSLRHRAKRQFGLRSVREAHAGAVAFIQRFDSALRLNVHPHVLCLDGVYVLEQGEARFLELAPPSAEDITWVARGTFERAKRLLARRGLLPGADGDDAEADRLSLEHSGAGRLLRSLGPWPRAVWRSFGPARVAVGRAQLGSRGRIRGCGVGDRRRLQRACRPRR